MVHTMRTKAFPLLPIFRSELQAELLALLLLDPERRMTRPELIQHTSASEPTVRRHLNELQAAGVVRSDTIGKTRRYWAATDSPLFEPLRLLVERTVGPEAELRRRLSAVEGVKAAVIYGSWAAEKKIRPDSDIDVLVIGDVDFDELTDIAGEIEEFAGREIHLVSYTPDEFEQKLAGGSGLAETILERPLKALVGDIDTLRGKR